MQPSPSGSQRWVSQSEMSYDCSPTPPMSGLRKLCGSEGHWNHIGKQHALLRPGPPPLHQKCESESESEGSLRECPASLSSGLRRGHSDSCRIPYNKSSAKLLPEVESSESDEKQADFVQPPSTIRFVVERWASGSLAVHSLDESPASPMPGLRRYVSEGCGSINKSPNYKKQARALDFAKVSPSGRLNSLKRHADVFGKH